MFHSAAGARALQLEVRRLLLVHRPPHRHRHHHRRVQPGGCLRGWVLYQWPTSGLVVLLMITLTNTMFPLIKVDFWTKFLSVQELCFAIKSVLPVLQDSLPSGISNAHGSNGRSIQVKQSRKKSKSCKRKGLRLAPCARQEFTTGQMTNLVALDTQKLVEVG